MKFITPSFILLFGFVLGGIMFKSVTPMHCGTIMSNDSIFVLTGDARRIPYAIRLNREHPGTSLYIIGAGATITNEAARRAKIESKSKSTYQNARAIKQITAEHGLNRIILITTEDHINRALYLVRHEMPDIDVVACPVRLMGMKPAKRLERWTIEYIKYIVTLFGIKEG